MRENLLVANFLEPYCLVLLETSVMDHTGDRETSSLGAENKDNSVEITCFMDFLEDATLHFQIIRLQNQAGAEEKLMEKLINLGYAKPRLTSK